MKGYKGFDKDFKCRDTQYEIGKEFTADGELELCENGLHFCKYPLDVFRYYDPANSKFAKVEATGEVKGYKPDIDPNRITKKDTKVCTNKLKVCAEIGIHGLVNAAVEYIKDNIDTSKKQKITVAENKNAGSNSVAINIGDNSEATNTGDRSVTANTGEKSVAINRGDDSVATNIGDESVTTNTGWRSVATNTGNRSVAINRGNNSAVTNTGYCSAATNTGEESAATNTGNSSIATNTGEESAATNTGDDSVATNIGNRSVATNTGNRSIATNTGEESAAINTGYCTVAANIGARSVAANTGNSSAATNTGSNSVAANTGNNSAAVVTGENSIAVSIGCKSVAKGSLGSWIVLAEYVCGSKIGKSGCIVKDVQCFYVDGKNILPDTFYRLKDGKAIVEEVNEELKELTEVKPEEE